MTSISFNFEIDDVDGEIFKRIDNTQGFMNKFGVLYRKDIYTLKDIHNNKVHQGYHLFKINNKVYCLEPTLKKLFNTVNYQFEIIDDKTIKIKNEVFKRIEDTEAFINGNGLVYRKDKNTMTDLKQNKDHMIKIKGKRYYLRKSLRDSFEIKSKTESKPKTKPKDKNEVIQEKQDKLLKDEKYNNRDILKDIPEDMKQLKEYKGKQLKDCYYYSKIKFGLYHKIPNTNLYYELKNKYPELIEKYENKRKYFNVITMENKTIPLTLNCDILE